MSVYKSPIGLSVSKNDWSETVSYTITGNVSQRHTIKEFESAYDFEEWIRTKVACKNIEFDSEYCQFFAYAKTKQQALAFVNRVEKYLAKLEEIFA